MKFLIYLFLLSLLYSHPAHAKDILVARDGSGNHESIKAALQAAQAGDTIYVKAGEYKESLRIKKDNISIIGAGFTKTRLVARETFPIKLKGVNGFRLEGFFINALTKQGYSGVFISASSGSISHCLITSEPNGYGIFCNKGAEVTIEHNTIVGNQKDGGIRFDESCKLNIKNNIIVNNSFGIKSKAKADEVNILYNNVWNNGKNYVNCRPAAGNISVDPQFIDPEAENYRLAPASPCRKAGEQGADMGPKEQLRLLKIRKKTPSMSLAKPPPKTAPKVQQSPQLEVSYELINADSEGGISAGQDIKLGIRIKNSGGRKAEGVKLEISSSSPGINSLSQELGDIKPQAEKRLQLKLPVDHNALNQEVELSLQITEQQGYNPTIEHIGFQLKSILKTGSLQLNSIPDQAEIYLDGILRGKTPLTIDEIKPGSHKLKLSKGLYGAGQQVEVEAGLRQTVVIQLKQRFGQLELSSRPVGARVYLDEALIGETPLRIPSLIVGEHRLKLIKYAPQAVLHYESPLKIKLGINQLEVTRFEKIIPPADMIYIPAGEFSMGSVSGENEEQPVHRVYLDDFYIDKYELTNVQYGKFTAATKHKPPDIWKFTEFNRPQQPVVWVSWKAAAAYCKWAGKSLPTEAQWEKAARGDSGYVYPWGDDFSYSRANIIVPGDGYQYTAPLGSYPEGASPYGVLDMAGNVAEWCLDWYAPDYYQHGPDRNPRGPESGEYRVVRGGSWNSPGYDIRTTSRWRYYADTPRSYIGFRCVWQP